MEWIMMNAKKKFWSHCLIPEQVESSKNLMGIYPLKNGIYYVFRLPKDLLHKGEWRLVKQGRSRKARTDDGAKNVTHYAFLHGWMIWRKYCTGMWYSQGISFNGFVLNCDDHEILEKNERELYRDSMELILDNCID